MMPILALLALVQPPPLPTAPPCRPGQLRLSAVVGGGDVNGMSHSGAEVSIRNRGRDCTLPALPIVQLRDARGRTVAMRQPPVGMHPGPMMVPVRLGGGHRAAMTLRWVSGAVYPDSRSVRAARVAVRIGATTLTAPAAAVVYGQAGKPVTFEQTPLRAVEGMAAG